MSRRMEGRASKANESARGTRGLSKRLQRSLERWRSGRRPAGDAEASPVELDSYRPLAARAADEPEAASASESPATAALEAEVRNLRRLHEVIHFLAAAEDAVTLVPEVLDLALSVAGLSRGVLALADREVKTAEGPARGTEFSVRLIRGIAREERRSPEIRVLRRLLSQSLERREPAFEPDVRRAPCADGEPDAEKLALGAAVALPLEAGGRLLGALLLDDPARTEPFGAAEVDLLKTYARHAGLALARCLRLHDLSRKRDRARSERDELARRLERKERELEKLRGETASQRLRAARDRLDDLLDKPYARAKRAFLKRYLRETVERERFDLERAARAAGLTVAKLARLLDLHEITPPSRADVRGSDTGSRAGRVAR